MLELKFLPERYKVYKKGTLSSTTEGNLTDNYSYSVSSLAAQLTAPILYPPYLHSLLLLFCILLICTANHSYFVSFLSVQLLLCILLFFTANCFYSVSSLSTQFTYFSYSVSSLSAQLTNPILYPPCMYS
jgi:hypothetical protein